MAEEKTLEEALLAVQSELKNPKNDKTNPHFKNSYVSLKKLLDEVKPPLVKHGLRLKFASLYDPEQGGWLWLTQIKGRGEVDEVALPWTPSDDPQKNASATTYAKRQGLCALLAVAGDDDDDGNAASAPKNVTSTITPAPDNPLPENAPDQTDMYRAEIKAWLIEMSAGDKGMFSDLLEMNTEFTDKKGQLIRGKRDLKDPTFSDAWVKTTHHRVKQAHEEWKNPPAEGLDDYPT